MSENRTEQPTPKRIREARQQGNIAQSAALTNAVLFLGLLLVFAVEAGTLARSLVEFAAHWWSASADGASVQRFAALWNETTFSFLGLFVRLGLCAAILPALIALAQRGWLFLPEKAVPDFSRLDFGGVIQRFFSTDTLWRFVDAALKTLFCAAACRLFLNRAGETICASAADTGPFVFHRLMSTAFSLGIALLILSAADLIYRRWKWNRDLMMTPEQVRREREESEGKPEIKALRNDLVRSFRRRMK